MADPGQIHTQKKEQAKHVKNMLRSYLDCPTKATLDKLHNAIDIHYMYVGQESEAAIITSRMKAARIGGDG